MTTKVTKHQGLDHQALDTLNAWHVKQEVSHFVKMKLSEKNKSTNKTNADEIIESAMQKAKYEDRPEWTKLLLDAAAGNEKNKTQQVNIFAAIASDSNAAAYELTKNKAKKNNITDLI